MNNFDMSRKLSSMYDNVEEEYQHGSIRWEEKEKRQTEIMKTWRMIQP